MALEDILVSRIKAALNQSNSNYNNSFVRASKGEKGYDIYFSIDNETVLLLPITPGELTINVGSNNEVINLIDEGDINLLKSPALIEVEFEARFPMRTYPYSRVPYDFQTYLDVIKKLKEEKLAFDFIVIRKKPNWSTKLRMALEEFELKESHDEGDDVLINFKLKQYKEYGVKILKKANTTTSTSSTPRDQKKEVAGANKLYTVVSGDCLWLIAKRFYGDGSKWTKIYDANKAAIEADAKKHGKASSSNGNWIFPGLRLTIPGVSAFTLTQSEFKKESAVVNYG